MNVAVIGLGLIGGSFAKATKNRTSHTVYGYDIDAETLMLARLCGAMDGTLDDEKLESCALVIVALRPDHAISWIREHGETLGKGNCLVVDICGVKRQVCSAIGALAEAYHFRYVGGHPMAGRERSGFVSSTEALFDGASMILTPDASVSLPTLELLKAYFTDLGFARLTFTTPEEHDKIIAYTSQLAHSVSGAYIKSPTALQQRGFSAGSFRDLTRVARLDEHMWTELMMDNRDYLVDELHTLIANLQGYLDALETSDADALCERLKEGRIAKAQAGGN